MTGEGLLMRYRDPRGYRGDDDIELDEETLAELNRWPVAPGKRPLTRNLGLPVGYVQRKVGGDGEVTPSARETLRRALGSPGQPLRQDLQRGFGVAVRPDLDAVRIHTDEQADAAAKAYGARALTVGHDIFFRAGEYDPDSYRGRHLIAHEVAHTLQQPRLGGPPQAKLEVSEPGDSHEKEADAFADRFVAGLGNEVDRSQPLPAITRIGSMGIHRKATDRKEAGSTSAAYLRKHGRRLMRQLKIRAMQAQLGNPGSAHARWRPGAIKTLTGKVLSSVGPETISLATWRRYLLMSAEAAIESGRAASDGSTGEVDEFRHAVVYELYKQLLGVLTASLRRVMPRYLAERNQAILAEENKLGRSVEPADIEAWPANVLVSHPMDRLVVEGLCAGIVEFDVDGYRKANPGATGENAPSAKLRPVSLQFEPRDPMCRVVRVIQPADARPEEVAAELYGDPALAYLLLPARPLFGFRFPPSGRLARAHHDRWAKAAMAAGVSAERLSRNARENDEPIDALVALSGLRGETIDPAMAFALGGTPAQPADSSAILARFDSITAELATLQQHATTFGRGDALGAIQARIEARRTRCRTDPSSCRQWDAQSKAQLQILRSVRSGLSVAAAFAEQQQGLCADESTGISGSLHAPLVRVASAFIDVATVSDLPEVARPRLGVAQQRLNAYPVDAMEEVLRYVRTVAGSMTASDGTLNRDFKRGPSPFRLANAEARLRGKLLVIRENLLHNPVVALAMLLEVEGEVRRLKFESRLGARMRALEDLKETLIPMWHRVSGLRAFVEIEFKPLWKLWGDATATDKAGRTVYPLAEAEKRLDALARRPQFATIIKQTLDFVQDEAAKDRIRAAAKVIGLTTLLSLGGPLAVGAGAAPEVGAASIAEGGAVRWLFSGERVSHGLANVGANLIFQGLEHGSNIDEYDIPEAALDYVIGAISGTLGYKVEKRWPLKFSQGGWKSAKTWLNIPKQQSVFVPYAMLVGTIRSFMSKSDRRKEAGARWLEGTLSWVRRQALLGFLQTPAGKRLFPGGKYDPRFIYTSKAIGIIQKAAIRHALMADGEAKE